MNELSLFSGGGGGLLGTKLLGFNTIGYVENDDYCQEVLANRINEGFLDVAPIFTDVQAFADIAHEYRGFAQVLTAGFPCQPFSTAGKQEAQHNGKNMWPSTIRCIEAVRPEFIFLENVPGLLSAGLEESVSLADASTGHFRYIYTIFRDLAIARYNVRWCVLGANDCGAPHRRKRLWIFAYTKHFGLHEAAQQGEDVRTIRGSEERPDSAIKSEGVDISAPMARLQGRTTGNTWWRTEAGICRVGDGMADRMDRIKMLGNGQVPAVVAEAWKTLSGFQL